MLIGRLFIAWGVTLLWFTTAWAVTDNQEAICDQPYVLFCDNFDARALGQGDFSRATYKNAGWQYSNLNALGGSTSIVQQADPQGNTSNVLDLPCNLYGSEAPGANVCAGYLNGMLTQVIPYGSDFYFRWYTKWSAGFKHSWGEKHAGALFGCDSGCINGFNTANRNAGNSSPPVEFYLNLGVIPNPSPCINNVYQPTGSLNAYFLYPCSADGTTTNSGTGLADGVWNCFEVHYRLNPDTDAYPSTGIAELWINGQPQFSWTNLNLAAHSIGGFAISNANRYFFAMNVYARWYCAGGTNIDGPDGASCVCAGGPGTCDLSPSTHPAQDRWHDNVVVATQRVGCLGNATPSNTTPPIAPTNLRVSFLWDAFWKVFSTLAGMLG